MNRKEYTYRNSLDLYKRAIRVIPGGIYGPKNPGFVVPGSYPYYFSHAKGCRFTDADGNEFIDFMCGYGSQLLGYGYDPVEEKAAAQLRKGDLLNGPAPVMVELSEILVDRIRDMDWAVYAKNGTDVTTLAVTLARVHTGKKKILCAREAYHGAANWCSSNDYPVLEEKNDVLSFEYNNLEELEALFAAHRGQIACLILTPYHHPAFTPQLMPREDLYPRVQALCRNEGALFVMDDIRANFRLDPAGSHVFFGAHPDLVTMGKSVANGHPMAVLMGKEEFRKTASGFFITGTYWMSAVPMIAAVETLKEMERLNYLEHINRMGIRLREGLEALGREFGYSMKVSGPPAIPFLNFTEDPDMYLNQIFCASMTRRGIYLHPHHNWFISWAHKEGDIDETLETARGVLKEMREGKTDRV